MIEPGRLDISLYTGVTFDLQLTWSDQDDEPYDLSDFTAEMQIKTSPLSPNTIFTLSTETGEISLGSSEPNIILHLDAEDVSIIPLYSSHGAYDLKLTDSTGTILLLLRGKVNFHITVTS
jgi:hypothetical protein